MQIPKFGFILSKVRVCNACAIVVQEEADVVERQAAEGKLKPLVRTLLLLILSVCCHSRPL